MRLQKSWFTAVIIGISGILAVWVLAAFMGGGWLRDAPGYPVSVLFAGACLVVLNLGWSLTRLRTATGHQRIPRVISVVAASLLAIGVLLSSLNLLSLSSDQTTSYPVPSWLLPLTLILAIGASLIEAGWGKTNVQAWLRVSGAALIGGIVLFGFLIAWILWFA